MWRFLIIGASLVALSAQTLMSNSEQPAPSPVNSSPSATTADLTTSAVNTANNAPSEPAPIAELDLKSYQWKNRVVLVFAPSEADPHYQQQVKELSDKAGMDDRDLVVIYLFEQGRSTVVDRELSQAAVSTLRQEYGLAHGQFKFVLIGKDGGAKMQQNTPVTRATLFDTIDAMPMRQNEK